MDVYIKKSDNSYELINPPNVLNMAPFGSHIVDGDKAKPTETNIPSPGTVYVDFIYQTDNAPYDYAYIITFKGGNGRSSQTQICIPWIDSSLDNIVPNLCIRSVTDVENRTWSPWRRLAYYDEIASVAKSSCPFPVGFACLIPDSIAYTIQGSMINAYPGTSWTVNTEYSDYSSASHYLLKRTS